MHSTRYKALTHLRDQAKRYSEIAIWYLRDALARYRKEVLKLEAANLIGIAFQAAALIISYSYASALEGHTTLIPFERIGSVGTSVVLLSVTALSVLSLLVIASISVFWARLGAIRIGRQYADFCMKRAVVTASRRLCRIGPVAGSALGKRKLENLRHNSQYCGIAFKILIDSLLPLATAIAAGVALIILGGNLTFLVLTILAASAFFVYRTSLEGAAAREQLQQQAGGVSIECRQLLDRVAYLATEISYTDSVMFRFFASGAIARYGDAFETQRAVLEKSTFISRVSIAVTIFGILGLHGAVTLGTGGNWSALIAYLAVLSIFATNFAATVRMLTSINRFYPTIRRYALFVFGEKDVDSKPISSNRARVLPTVVLRGTGLEGAEEELDLVSGARILLLLSGRLTRSALNPLIAALRVTLGPTQEPISALVWFARSWRAPMKASLREMYGFPGYYMENDLIEDLRYLGVSEDLCSRLAPNLDSQWSATADRVLTDEITLYLAAIAGLRRGKRIIVIDEVGLSRLPIEQRLRFLDLLQECVVFIAVPSLKFSWDNQYGAAALAVADSEKLLGWAPIDALANKKDVVTVLINKLRHTARSRVRDEDEDLDEIL